MMAKEIKLPPEDDAAWDEVGADVGGRGDPVAPAPREKLRVGIIGDNYLTDSVRIVIDPRLADVTHAAKLEELDELIEWRPNLVYVCTDINVMKNDTLDDAEFIDAVSKIAKQTQAGICIKTTMNQDTLNRVVGAVGVDYLNAKVVYAPEVESTLDGILNSEYALLGGQEKAVDALNDLLHNTSSLFLRNVYTNSIQTIMYVALGVSGFVAAKQTYFNQFHNAISELGGANPAVVRRLMAGLPQMSENKHMLPLSYRSKIDPDASTKKTRTASGEYQNKAVKMFIGMTDKMSLLEECMNLRNLKD